MRPEILNWSWDNESKSKAQGFLSYFEKFSTSVVLITLRNALNFVKPLASKLQKSDLDIWQAYEMIDTVITSLDELQTNAPNYFLSWWSQMIELAACEPVMPRLVGRQTQRSNLPTTCNPDIFSDQHEGPCCKSYYFRSTALPFVNHLVSEVKSRFEQRISVAMIQLIPQLMKQRDFAVNEDDLLHWKDDLPSPDMLKVSLVLLLVPSISLDLYI